MKNKTKTISGFTLIELMVVVVILAILSAVVAPRIPGYVRKAREGKTKGNLASLCSAVQIYFADNDGVWPGYPLSISIVPRCIKEIPPLDLRPLHPLSRVVGGPVITDDGEWSYNLSNGSVNIDCTHTDSTGVLWSSY